jgi:hypothetical protein
MPVPVLGLVSVWELRPVLGLGLWLRLLVPDF